MTTKTKANARMRRNVRVRGQIEPATAEGFANLIDTADELLAEGFALIGVVNLGQGKALGGVYRRLPERPTASLVGD